MDNTEIRLARCIRAERQARGWSQADLAAQADVAKASVSKIERGEMSPSAGLLARLAAAFGLTLAGLAVLAERGGGGRLIRAADQPLWRDPASGYQRRQVFGRPDHPLELTEAELPSGGTVTFPAWTFVHARPVVWCRAGRLTVHEGEAVHHLAPGDSLGFGPPAQVTYTNEGPGANEGPGPCRFVVGLVRG